MRELRADLHMHTAYSDGALTPAYIADIAVEHGVELLAVTDHDTMGACDGFLRVAGSKGLKAVNGVEISAYVGTVKVHTLGYNLDKKKIEPFLYRLREGSLERAADIVSKLNKSGIGLTMDDVCASRSYPDSPVHVFHIAAAAVKKGYAENPWDFFNAYLAYGKPAFSCICRPSPERTVEEITAAGGLAVVAHPGRISMDKEALRKTVTGLKERGLGGIEVYYSTHTDKETAYYKRLAESLGLLCTGGSDTHRPEGGREIGKPRFYASEELLEKLGID